MSPAEFFRIRERLGVSQARLADLLGVDARTIRRLEAGDSAINGPTAVLMRAFASGTLAVQE